ncbi:MAG: hypothetical protein ACR2MO_09620 [Acidimicrobiales bacterium]
MLPELAPTAAVEAAVTTASPQRLAALEAKVAAAILPLAHQRARPRTP